MKIGKSSFIWNIVGSGISAGSSFVLLFCVTRVVGVKDGGIFSLAFATAQMLLTIGKYGVRSFQATDISEEVSFCTYLVTRCIFCLGMVLCGFLYVLTAGFDFYKSAIVMSVCLLKMVDAAEDVFHGQLQLINKLDVAGMLLSFRNLFTIILFAIIIFIKHDLLYACFLTALVSLGVCLLTNIIFVKKYQVKNGKLNRQQGFLLFKACTPLFIGQFLSIYIYNTPKYALARFCAMELQTYYAIIFMPAFVINMFSEFVFKPLLTVLAEWWHENRIREFGKVIFRLSANIGFITAGVLVMMYLCGIPLLSFVYKTDLNNYKTDLLILITGGGFSASVYFLYNVLTSMRKQKAILMNYFFGSFLAVIISNYSVRKLAIRGASISYLTAEIVLFILMAYTVIKEVKRKRRKLANVEIN